MMKKFYLLFLMTLFALVAGAQTSTPALGDIIIYDEIAYVVVDDSEVCVAPQSANGGKTTGEVVIPSSFTYGDGTTYTVTAIALNAFQNASITSAEVPGTITKWYDPINGNSSSEGQPFYNCTSLTSVKLDEGLTTLGGSMFYGCSALEEVSVPEGITALPTSVFSNCSALKTVYLPSTMASLGGKAFSSCKALTELYCYATTPPSYVSTGSPTFNGVTLGNITLYVYCDYQEVYAATEPYSSMNIETIDDCAAEPDYSYTIYPEPGVVDDISVIEVIYPNTVVTKAKYFNSLTCVTVVKDDETVSQGATCTVAEDGEGGSVATLTLTTPVTDPGTYTVTLHTFVTYDDGTDADDIVIEYIIEGSDEPSTGDYTLTFDPENGGSITLTTDNDFRDITIACEDGIAMSSTGSSRTWVLRDNDQNLGVSFTRVEPNDEGTAITFHLASAISASGTYYLAYTNRGTSYTTIPAGTFLLGPNEVESEEMEYGFTVVIDDGTSTGDYTLTFDPESGKLLDSFNTVEVSSEVGMNVNEFGELSYDIYLDGNKVDGYVLYCSPFFTGAVGEENNYTSLTFKVRETEGYTDASLTEAGTYTVTIPAGGITFVDGTPCDNYTLTYIISGGAEETPEFVSIVPDPDDGDISRSLTEIVVTYSGNVKIDESTTYINALRNVGNYPDPTYFASITNADNAEYATTWTLTIPEGYLTETLPSGAPFNITVTAIGTNGNYVTVDGDTYVRFEYTVSDDTGGESGNNGYEYYPADGATVESLSEFTVIYADGINCSWNYTKDITVTNEEGTVVANSADCEDNDDETSCLITLDTTITEPGEYTVSIPEGYFIVGSHYDNSQALTITYYIGGSATPVDYTLTYDPEPGEVPELGEIVISCEGGIKSISAHAVDVDVYDASGKTVGNLYWSDNGDYEYTTNDEGYYTSITLKMLNPTSFVPMTITDAGEYSFTIPAGKFTFGDDSQNENIPLTYIIEAEEEGGDDGFTELVMDEEYNFDSYTDNYYKYTATVDGTLSFAYYGVSVYAYSDPEMTDQISPDYDGYVNGLQCYHIDVTAGTTYYFNLHTSFDAGRITFSFDGDEEVDDGWEELTLDQIYSIEGMSNYAYYKYTPTSDGKLYVNYLSMNQPAVYTDPEMTTDSQITTNWVGYVSGYSQVYYDLTAGETYYLAIGTGINTSGTFFATYEGEEEVDDGYEKLVIDKQYDLTGSMGETFYYKYTPSSDGTIDITRSVSGVQVTMFSDADLTNSVAVTNTYIDGYWHTTVDMTAGETYYIKVYFSLITSGWFIAEYEASSGGTTYDVTLTLVVPDYDSTEMATLPDGYTLVVTADPQPEAENGGYMTFALENVTDGTTDRSGYFNYTTDDELGIGLSEPYYWWESAGSTTLYEGCTYELTVTLREGQNPSSATLAQQVLLTIEGLTERYVYSDISFVSIEPDPETTTLTELADTRFTVNFDGPVVIVADDSAINFGTNGGGLQPFTLIESASGEAYDTTWYLTVSEALLSYLTGDAEGEDLKMNVAAEDEQGRRVHSNNSFYDNEGGTYLYFEYETDFSGGVSNYTVTVDPADGATLSKIDKITFSCEDHILYYSNPETVLILDDEGDEVAYGAEWSDNGSIDDDGNVTDATEVYLTISPVVTAEGNYTVVVPAATFVLGDNGYQSKYIETHYYVDGSEAKEYKVTTDPASGGEVSKIDKITFSCEDNIAPNVDPEAVVVYNDDGDEVAYGAEWSDNSADGVAATEVYLTISPVVTAEGNYTVGVPAGAFILGDDHSSTEINIVVYVDGSEAKEYKVTTDPANGGKVSKIDKITFSCEDNIAANVDPEAVVVYDDEGDEVAYGAEWSDNSADGVAATEVYLTISPVVTAEGNYTVGVPAGAFILGDDHSSTEIDMVVYVDGSEAKEYKVTTDPANGGEVSKIDKITFSCEDNIAPNVDPEAVVVYNGDGDEVAYGAEWSDNSVDGAPATEVYLTISPVVTAEDGYTIVVPEGAFILGDDHSSTEINIVVYVDGSAVVETPELKYNPEPGSENEYSSLSQVVISCDEGIALGEFSELEFAITLYGETTDYTLYCCPFFYDCVGEDGNYTSLTFVVKKDGYDSSITAGGMYAVVIPAGAIKFVNGTTNEEQIVLEYYIVGETIKTITVSPNDEIVGKIDVITLSADEDIAWNWDVDLDQLTVTDSEGIVVAYGADMSDNFSWDTGICTEVYVTLNTVVTAAGDYTINVPESAIYFSNNGSPLYSEAAEAKVTVDGSEDVKPDFTLTYEPEEGVVEYLDHLTINCEGGISMFKGSTYELDGLFLYKDGVKTNYQVYWNGKWTSQYPTTQDANGNYTSITAKVMDYDEWVEVTVTEPGEYTITLNAGDITFADGSVNEEAIVLTYTIEGEAADYTLTFDPADNAELEQLDYMTIYCEGGMVLKNANGYDEVVLYIYDEDGNDTGYAYDWWYTVDSDNGTVDSNGNYTSINLTLVDKIDFAEDVITTPGKYTLKLASDLPIHLANGDLVEDVTLTYTVKGDAELYGKIMEEVDALQAYLDEIWVAIQEQHPEIAGQLEPDYEYIADEIETLIYSIEEVYEDGDLSDYVDYLEEQIAAIYDEIDQLAEDAGGVETGLKSGSVDYSGMNVYTLTGQKVNAPTSRGIYIINGKKVYIK